MNTSDIVIAKDTATVLLDIASANLTSDQLVDNLCKNIGVQSAISAVIRTWGEAATKAALANIFGKDVSDWLHDEQDEPAQRDAIRSAA